MKSILQMLLVSVATVVAADTAFAQTGFTSAPKDTIIATVPLEEKRVLTFQQYATSANVLNLSWRQLTVSLPGQWEANLCDNGNCYPDLPVSGSMSPVPVGDYGLMTLDVKPRVNPGTAVIRYAVWENSAPTAQDTLTWIIHSYPTTIIPVNLSKPMVVITGGTLFIRQDSNQKTEACLFDFNGRMVLTTIFSNGESAFDVSRLSSGIYLLRITSLGHQYVQKIKIGSLQ